MAVTEATKKARRSNPRSLRHGNGSLKASAITRIRKDIVNRMEDGTSRRDLLIHVIDTYDCQHNKAEALIEEAEQQFLREIGVSKPQMRYLIYKRAQQTLADDEASGKDFNDATRILTQLFNLKEEQASANKTREVRLWKDMIDLMDVEEQELLSERFETDGFEIDDISEAAVEAKRDRAGRRRK